MAAWLAYGSKAWKDHLKLWSCTSHHDARGGGGIPRWLTITHLQHELQKAILQRRLGRDIDTDNHEMIIAADVINPGDIDIGMDDIGGLEDTKKTLVSQTWTLPPPSLLPVQFPGPSLSHICVFRRQLCHMWLLSLRHGWHLRRNFCFALRHGILPWNSKKTRKTKENNNSMELCPGVINFFEGVLPW